MATEAPVQTQKPQSKPNLALPDPPALDAEAFAELRHRFAGIALAEIVRWQVAEGKGGQEDVAAAWAFRYADRMMTQSLKKPSRGVYIAKGVPGVTEEPMVEAQ